MKKHIRCLLSLLTAVTLLFSLGTVAFAAGKGSSDEITVFFSPDANLELNVGDKATVSAIVSNADKGASYQWECSDPSVVKLKTNQGKVTVTALKEGSAMVSLTVTSKDGSSSDFDFFCVSVGASYDPVQVSGGTSVKLEAGETKKITAKATGGSGKYTYEWEAYGDAALSFAKKNNASVEVYAGKKGTGTVIVTVYDAKDPNNNDTETWDFTVTSKATPPEVTLNRGTVDLGPGSSGVLMASVSGGSGSYEYIWRSDNPGVVSVDPDGDTAEITASTKLRADKKNSAEISLYVRDKKTNLTSDTVSCIVHVSGASSTFDALGDTKVGEYFPMNDLAKEMNLISLVDFGKEISLSATIKFVNNASRIGSIYLQDGTVARAGTSYTFASFQDMYFRATAAGSFKVDYILVDGVNTLSGKISLGVEAAGVGVEKVSMRETFVDMPTYSNEYLTLSVTPARASYDVSWTVDDTRLVTVSGSGSKVTVTSKGRTGTTAVTATVTDVYGSKTTAVCYVTVYDDSSVEFDTSITVMLGSDYYGSKLADSMSNKFKNAFGVYPADGATFVLTSLGNSRYGDLHLQNGKTPSKNKNYTFGDWVNMYFTPYAKGTYSADYTLTYKGDTMSGTIKIIIDTSNLTVGISNATLTMSPYSSQYLSLSIAPASAYYRVSWTSTDTSVVKVSGSNTTAIIESSGPGTATVYATVTDINGYEIRRGCTILVEDNNTAFNPTVATTIGIPYNGTGTSSAMRSQFKALYSIELTDDATIRFASTGNNAVGILRLADGSVAKPNVNYTFAQYVEMYTDPISAGTFSFPYTLTGSKGQTLSGTVSVVISQASISNEFTLPAKAAYSFSDPINGLSAAAVFSDTISNTVGAGWAYIRFSSSSDSNGTLYQDRNLTAIKADSNISPVALEKLYFVPTELNGTFSASYSVYNLAGSLIGSGTLKLSQPSTGFSDVPSDAFYATAVNWAVEKGVTSGTGGNNFSPDMPVNRGQAVTFLWRAAGQPKSTLAVNPFTDVIEGVYYYEAVLWAVQQGITNGTSDTAFSPELPLNRDQLLTFLCRANGGYAGGADWSKLAVEWANSRNLLNGVPGTFSAASPCPRSEVVYYLWKNYSG